MDQFYLGNWCQNQSKITPCTPRPFQGSQGSQYRAPGAQIEALDLKNVALDLKIEALDLKNQAKMQGRWKSKHEVTLKVMKPLEGFGQMKDL